MEVVDCFSQVHWLPISQRPQGSLLRFHYFAQAAQRTQEESGVLLFYHKEYNKEDDDKTHSGKGATWHFHVLFRPATP